MSRPPPPPALPCTAVYIVMQYANGGNLYDALTSSKWGRFSEKRTARYMSQILE